MSFVIFVFRVSSRGSFLNAHEAARSRCAAGSSTTGAPTPPWCSASRPRSPCSPGRCWSATRSAAACATSCCSASAGPIARSCPLGFFPRGARRRRSPCDGSIAGRGDPPLIAVEGTVSSQASGRRASRVQVYGVDDRFWRLSRRRRPSHGPEGREALVSPALASDIGATAGSVVLVRIERPSAIPIESLHGRKDDAGRTLRLNVSAILGAGQPRRVLAAAAAGRRARCLRAAGAAAAGSRSRQAA